MALGDDAERVDVVLQVVPVAAKALERAQLDEALRVPLLRWRGERGCVNIGEGTERRCDHATWSKRNQLQMYIFMPKLELEVLLIGHSKTGSSAMSAWDTAPRFYSFFLAMSFSDNSNKIGSEV